MFYETFQTPGRSSARNSLIFRSLLYIREIL